MCVFFVRIDFFLDSVVVVLVFGVCLYDSVVKMECVKYVRIGVFNLVV